ncbi:MAG: HAMP domain-containing sensor histidine kinase [Kofleriaceae bacterium]|nr:HAMP domain-containing sensor histidine kinase [Kofleriaceae bacterium]
MTNNLDPDGERTRLLAHIARVSHELRTPMSAIIGWAQRLRSTADCVATREQALVIIERNALQQAALIDDLMDVSRAITGKLHCERRLVSLREVVEAEVASARPVFDCKQVHIETSLGAGCHLLGDALRLHQVTRNLLSNAVKFTPSFGRVEVTLVEHDAWVELVVADTGIGIQRDFLSRVFEPFEQADSRALCTRGGLGLGLAIVKAIVEQHGGVVTVESAGAQQGTTFRVRLPATTADEPTEPAPLAACRDGSAPAPDQPTS